MVTSNVRGHTVIWNEQLSRWEFEDGTTSETMSCSRCGEFPNERGDDYCIQNLGYVVNACCGHGKEKGYIMFDDGRVIEGYFRVRDK